MKQYTISLLAKKIGLSRSILLHYDSINLLKPTMRNGANYRVYTDKYSERLQRICSLRSTGISLEQIRELINSNNTTVTDLL